MIIHYTTNELIIFIRNPEQNALGDPVKKRIVLREFSHSNLKLKQMEKATETKTPEIKKNSTFWSMSLAERKHLILTTVKGFARNGIKAISQLRGYIFWLKVSENNEKIHNLLISAGFKYSESKKEYYIVLAEKGQALDFEKYAYGKSQYDKYKATLITADNISLLIV